MTIVVMVMIFGSITLVLWEGASDVAAAGVLESDHGRLHWRPSRAIMS